MRTTKPILLLPVVLALLAACGQNAENSAPAAYAPAAAAAEYGEAAANQETAVRADSMVLAQKAEGRQLVVEADIAFKTENTRQTVAEVEKLTLQYGGFIEKSGIFASVSDEQTYPQQDGVLLVIRRYGQTGDMTVRLPKDKTADFLRDMQKHIVFLQEQNFSAADVALDLRRAALEAARQRELAERLQNTADSAEKSDKSGTADVQVRQSDARAQQEYAELQRAYWQDKVDFATVRLRFEQPEAVFRYTRPDSDAEARQYAPGFWQSVGVMLKQGWVGFLRGILFLFALWPLALLAVMSLFSWRKIKRMKKKTK